MEVAGTGDLRAHVDLPLALRVLGKPRDPALRAAVAKLRAWRRDGGLRKRRQPRRRLRAQRRDPDHGRVVAAVGRRRSSARRSGKAAFDQLT